MTTDFKQLNADMGGLVKALGSAQPDMMAGFQALKKGVIYDGALSAKFKELIGLALGVYAQCEPCIGYHAKMCVEYGATREEVAEMLSVCVFMGGGPKLNYASKALAAFDALAKR